MVTDAAPFATFSHIVFTAQYLGIDTLTQSHLMWLASACLCDTLVHPACIVHVIRSVPSHRKACALCKHPYRTTAQTRLVATVQEPSVIVMYGLGALSLSAIVFACLSFPHQLVEPLQWLFVAAVLCKLSMLISVHRQLYMRHGRFCCVSVQRRPYTLMVHPCTPLQRL